MYLCNIKWIDIIYTNIHYIGTKLEKEKPSEIEQGKYRTWQINQPFVSNNDISKIDLSDTQKQQIINNIYIMHLYPEIMTIIW